MPSALLVPHAVNDPGYGDPARRDAVVDYIRFHWKDAHALLNVICKSSRLRHACKHYESICDYDPLSVGQRLGR
jgi:hypothetical protein